MFINRKFLLYLLVFVSSFATLSAQNNILFVDGFEDKVDTSWVLNRASQEISQSYKGQKSLRINGLGEASKLVNIRANIDEIIVKGWVKLEGAPKYDKKNVAGLIILNCDNNKYDSINFNSNDLVCGIHQNEGWTYVEKEIKLLKGTTQIKLLCKNTFEHATLYIDELQIEKRQIGFVKKEMPWATAVSVFNKRSGCLIKNGNFEDGAQIWNAYWGFETSNIAHSGDYSCLIQNKDSGTWRGSSNLEPFKIPSGTTKLKVSTWLKADNVVGGLNVWETGAVLLSFTDDFGNEIPGGDAIARTVGTHDWRKFETYFSVPERATKFVILLQMAASTGKLYIDDLVADPMSNEEYFRVNANLKNPGFEDLLSGWPSYAGEATRELAHSGEYSLLVGGTNAAWEMRMQTLSILRDKKELNFSVWMKTVNVTETPNVWEGAVVFIEFKDINGISLNTVNIARAIGNTDWTKYSKRIQIPDDAVEFTIQCGRGNVTGKIYFDDAFLEY